MTDTKISAASRLTGTGIVKRPVALAGSTLSFALADNYEATTNPGVGDDDLDGYSIGSVWQRKDTGQLWFCRDASTGAARWMLLANDGLPNYLAGSWYPSRPAVTINSATLTANNIRLSPIFIRHRCTLSDLAVRLTTAASGGNVQLAIYANDPATNRPTGTALAATGDMSTTTTGFVSADITGADVTLEPGIYWVAINSDGTAGPTAIWQSWAAGDTATGYFVGSATLTKLSSGTSFSNLVITVSQTFGTWPDMTSASFVESDGSSQCALVYYKVSAVP